MQKEEWIEMFKEQCNILKINIKENQIEQFYRYMELLQEWNNNINLTSITEPKEILQKHFIDSLTILQYINNEDNIIDVGTGAGFPGIPIKILRENTKITLLDALNKRLKFLQDVISNLSLSNIYTLHERAEEAGKNPNLREKFDVAVSRAVAPLNVLVEYLIPFVKEGRKMYLHEGE